MRLIKFLLLLVLTIPQFSMALVESQPLAVDSRLRVIVYNPNDIFKYTGFYGYESSIVFSAEETVDSITMGDSLAWQLVPNGNRLFLKPIEPEATTNMTIITSKRVYHFELHAADATSIQDPNLVFSVKFLYPDDENNTSSAVQFFADKGDVDIVDKNKNINYDYTISGPESIAPIKIFDDGVKTYFEFSKHDQDLPSFYIVYNDLTEGLVNFNIVGKYVVIERVAPRFTLRRGTEEVGCVFNEKILKKMKDK
jgi:type IV secretion system protein VirB9